MYKILLAMPTPGTLESETSDCLELLKRDIEAHPELKVELHSLKTEGVYVFYQRNVIAKQALIAGMTHIYFCDNDMVFPPEILRHFLELDKDIISTNYVVKAKRGKCRFASIDENFIEIRTFDTSEGLQKVYAAPTGTMLIKTSVFKTIQEKGHAGYSNEDWFSHIPVRVFDKYDICGEDISFGMRANQSGIDVWIDHDMSKRVEHIGKKAFNWKDAL